MIEKATAAAGAMCVTDWKNTSRRPIASRLSPRSSGGVDAVRSTGGVGAERSIASLPLRDCFDYPLRGDRSRNLSRLPERRVGPAAYTPWALPIRERVRGPNPSAARVQPQPLG